MTNRKQNDFIMQAGILAAAGFISRIIGLLYTSPVQAIIGDEGLGYYSSTYNYYAIILLISSYSIPSAISKVIAQKLSLREYRNAHRIFICSMYYVLGVGLIASLFLYFGAGLFVEESAIPILRVLAPTIFLYGMLGVLRGYFQAHKTMVQTSVSQILEQIVNAIISVLAAWIFVKIATRAVADGKDVNVAVYGAMGSAIGTGAGVLMALLFMFGIYMLNRNYFLKRVQRDRTGKVDSYREISKVIAGVVLPFILSTAAYNLCASLNTKLFQEIMLGYKKVEESLVNAEYGVFSEASKISNIPIAFASAMAAAIIPTVANAVAQKDMMGARRKVYQAVKTIMLLSIPSAVGLLVLAKPVVGLIYPGAENPDLAAGVLMALSLSVVFYALSTLSNSILQGIGKVNTPIKNSLIAIVVQTVVLVPILLWTDWNVYALAIAGVVYSGVICILNQWSARKALEYRQEIITTFGIPAVSAIFMGAAAWGIYQGLYLLTKSNILSLIPTILIAIIVYFVLLILLRGVDEAELKGMPKGYMLVRMAKKMRLMK
ncbi:MAG: polysaccharide biosynthesis protein [Lachnospiraceae bacterium]|nr:polysaccharide biosynthesis protein [Lachnospiraceae bacterium]